MALNGTTAGAAAAALLLASAGAAGAGGPTRSFERIDTDGDGRISLAEAIAVRDIMFAGLDADADGLVTLDEMTEGVQARAGRHVTKRFEHLDTNGDDAIAPDEIAIGAERRFQRLDADGDGSLTPDEIARGFRRRGG